MPSVLALNSGSSSVKFGVLEIGADGSLTETLRGQVENIGAGLEPRLTTGCEAIDLPVELPAGLDSHESIIPHLIEAVILPKTGATEGGIIGVGHRVVHGGTRFSAAVLIDDEIRAAIEELTPLAPSHQPHNIAGIDAVAAALPDVPQIACFDTAFHRTIPEHRQFMALPTRFAEEGLRRFGFHGLSYERIVSVLPEIVGRAAQGRVVACHLGNGCSVAGIVDGRSQYTSMGFTPLDGLVMGRRPGRLDPGAVLWLVERHGGDVAAVSRLLNQEAGLIGVSGISSDMRTLLASSEPAAKLAVTMFVDRLVQEIGTTVAAIGGIDALVFSGGIGENAPQIRAMTVDALGFLGFRLDREANARNAQTISPPRVRPGVRVVPTDEELVIGQAVHRLVG